MRLLARSLVVLAASVSVFAAGLEEVLARMDQAAGRFSDVSAHVEKVNYTEIINDTEIETGRVWMSRSNGVRMRIEFSGDDQRSLAMDGRKGEIYYPKLNLVNEYNLDKFKDVVDQFLLFGFGTPGKELARDYQVKLIGAEDVGSVATTRLELVPKNRQARDRLPSAELWIADDGGYPMRQKFHWPSGDTQTLTYSDVKINTGLRPLDLTLKLPADVKREFPQR